MTSPARFGLTLPQRGVLFGVTTPEQILDFARRSDETSMLHSLWVGDSLTAKPRPDSLTLLGALAGATRRLRLGVGCMASFPVRDPAQFAYQWATLDLMSAGRMELAVCTGLVAAERASQVEGGHWGVTDKQRASRMEENIEICRRLWSGETVDFEGEFVSYQGIRIEPVPVQQPCPLWIAANPFPGPFRERALRRVASLADGWMSVELMGGAISSSWADIKLHLTELGRDPEAFPRVAYHNLNVATDRSEALAETARFLDAYYGPVFSPPMVEAWTAAGTVEECVAGLRRLIEGGATEVTLRLTSWDQEGQYQRFVDEVLPRLSEEGLAA